jgi:hypothetical protein
MSSKSAAAKDDRVTKRRVTMRNAIGKFDAEGKPYTEVHEATDYVNPEFLDAYVADAKLRWAYVEVSDEPDAGPGGYDGQTYVPAGIDHPEAGTTRPATEG